jgi:hypothetical protein
VAFFRDLGLGLAWLVFGFEATLEPEPLRVLAGVLVFEPSFGGALLTAGEDMVVGLMCVCDWVLELDVVLVQSHMMNWDQMESNQSPIEWYPVVCVKGVTYSS